VLPTANAAKVGLGDLSAAIAVMTKAGIKTPEAVNALRGAINALAAPTADAKKNMEALGITWQGLIPTLEAISKKNLSIDQMRLLIPDVRARTGVLALTQNFNVLVEALKEMDVASGAMEEAFDKMKDTPENQIKLFRNEMDALMISAGELAAKGLLPLARAFRFLTDSIRETDPATKAILGALAGAVGALTIWHIGLKHIVSGLGGFIIKARAAQILTGTLTTQFTAAGIAMKASLAASILYTSYQLATLGKEIYGAIKAHKAMRESQDRLRENSDRLIRKYEEFKDVRLPGNFTDLAQEDLEDLRKKLAAARVYYTALKNKMEESDLSKFLDPEGYARRLKIINERLHEIQVHFERAGGAATDAAEDMSKPAEAVDATAEQLDEFEKKAKAAYDEAKKQAADYAQKVIEWEDKIKYARMSTEDKIRELGRMGLEDAVVWADKRLQAEQKMYAAREAMARGDYKLAEELARDAESLYADLAQEVKKSEDGKDVVVMSLEETKQIAINGVQAVGDFVNELYTMQRDAAAKARDEWTVTADGIKNQLDKIAKQREANIAIQLKNLEAAQAAINNLVKDETKHITVVTHHVDAKRTGGPIYARAGRKFPGYGGGDRIRALLEAGEFIIRKEAVKKYGAGLFYALNAMKLDLNNAVRARIGGLLSNISIPEPRFAFQAGGIAGSGETMTIRFQAGNAEMPLNVIGNNRVTREMVKEFEKELIKMGLAKR